MPLRKGKGEKRYLLRINWDPTRRRAIVTRGFQGAGWERRYPRYFAKELDVFTSTTPSPYGKPSKAKPSPDPDLGNPII